MSIRPSVDFKRLGQLDNLLINTSENRDNCLVHKCWFGVEAICPISVGRVYGISREDCRQKKTRSCGSILFDDKTDCQCNFVDAARQITGSGLLTTLAGVKLDDGACK